MKFKIFLFLISFSSIYSQTSFKGKLIDIFTNEPIVFANIFDEKSGEGTYSNNDGEFVFSTINKSNTLTVSFLGYKTLKVDVDKLDKKIINIIYLEPDDLLLEEVVLTDKPLNIIVESIVENSKKELDRSVKLETYYREFVKINNQYSKFADGLIDYYLTPKRKDKVKAKVLVNESRAFELTKEEDLETKGTISSSLNSLFSFKDATNDFFSFNTIENYLIKTKTSEEYEFKIKRKVSNDGLEIEVIEIKPLPEIKKLLVEGYIIYDANKKIILEYELKVSELHKKYSEINNMLLFKVKINDFSLKVSFVINNNKYVPNYKKTYFDMYLKFGKMVNDNLSGTSDILVNHFQDENVVFPNKNDLYDKKSLYDNGMNFKTEYWKTNKSMLLSKNEELILESIKNK